MKKSIYVILLILFTMSCIGCTEKSQADQETNSDLMNSTEEENITQQHDEEQNTSVTKEPCFANDVNVTIQKTTFINELETADPGCFFVIATIEMNNAENVSYNINPTVWSLEWDGVMYSPDIPATFTDGINHPQTISDKELWINPGETASFQLVFQIQSALSSEPDPEYHIYYIGELKNSTI